MKNAEGGMIHSPKRVAQAEKRAVGAVKRATRTKGARMERRAYMVNVM